MESLVPAGDHLGGDGFARERPDIFPLEFRLQPHDAWIELFAEGVGDGFGRLLGEAVRRGYAAENGGEEGRLEKGRDGAMWGHRGHRGMALT